MSLLATSYAHCEAIMKAHSKSFYQAFRQLSEERFKGIAAVYAFCRYVDDLVDEAAPGDEAVDQQLALLAEVISGEVVPAPSAISNLPWWPAFTDSVARFAISPKALLEQIAGQQSDRSFAFFGTMAELETYCRQVAGSVGAMLLPMLGRADLTEEANQETYLEVCYQLGIAMQLTNILRDVGEDARNRQRVYLPEDLLAQVGKTVENVLSLANQPRQTPPDWFVAVWKEVAKESGHLYQTFEAYLSLFDPACQAALLSAARIYHAIEDEIQKADYDCLYQRHYTSKLKRLVLVQEVKKELNK
ncbi:phytoene/squalene synthase family protein [Streptococcus caprae]|uniref:Phytoene/squalene synthase family protein n=1 Tax=Streptococcus caprae TaxID=1640501 RepID=A0ABV8CY12_9STRE